MFAWQATVQDEAGNIVPLPVVTVYQSDGSTLADVYDETGAPLSNPLTGTLEGFVQFWANPGKYRIIGTNGGVTSEWFVDGGGLDSAAIPIASHSVAETVNVNPDIDVLRVMAGGRMLEYIRDPSGTALQTADGAWWSPAGEVTPQHWGAVADGVTDDTSAIQSALDSMAGGGGEVILPPGRYATTSTILIPSRVTLRGLGETNVLSGGQNIVYSGADVAVALADAEVDQPARGIVAEGIGVELLTPGATGFRIWRVRDLTLRNSTVRMFADNQIGFHIKGEKGTGTRMGVFDCLFERLISYCGVGHTGALHYKLSGVENQGQVNANVFVMCRGGGAGKYAEIGPSEGNTWIGPEAEGLTGDFFDFQDKAFNNRVYGGYAEAQSGYTGMVMRTSAGALRNVMDAGTIGINMSPSMVSLTTGNQMRWAAGRAYTAASGEGAYSVRLGGDANDRAQLSGDGLSVGNGTGPALLRYGLRHKTVNTLALGSSVAWDAAAGHIGYLNINAATDPTINTPSNVYEGDEVTLHIVNNSGGVRALTWGSGWIKASHLPASMALGQRLTARFFKQGSNFYLLGDFALM